MVDPQAVRFNNRLAHIGNVCSQWAEIEWLYAISIWFLLDLDADTGKIVTGGLDMRPRANMAKTLAAHKRAPKAFRQAINDGIKTLEDKNLDRERNRVVHGIQFVDVNGNLYLEVHRGKNRQQTPIADWEIQKIAAQLSEISEDMSDVIVPHIDQTRPDLVATHRKASVNASTIESTPGS